MVWDKEKCAEGILAPDLNDEIRANWAALEAALDAWIYFATGGTQTGQPRQGSARPYFQDAVPTVKLDGNYFGSTDLGTIWIDSNATIDNQFNILTAADGAGTETWTPISTEVIAVLLAANRIFAGTLGVTGNFAVNTDKFTVAAASGNTAIAGTATVASTLGVTGVATLGDGSTLATTAAPTAGSAEIANAKYVDDQDIDLIGTGVSRSKDTNYTAATSGKLVVMATITWTFNTDEFVTVLSDAATPPVTVVGKVGAKCTRADSANNIIYHTLVVPIIKGKNYRIEDTGATAVIDSITFYPNQ